MILQITISKTTHILSLFRKFIMCSIASYLSFNPFFCETTYIHNTLHILQQHTSSHYMHSLSLSLSYFFLYLFFQFSSLSLSRNDKKSGKFRYKQREEGQLRLGGQGLLIEQKKQRQITTTRIHITDSPSFAFLFIVRVPKSPGCLLAASCLCAAYQLLSYKASELACNTHNIV